MVNPSYLPVGFLFGILLGLFVKKSRLLNILLLILVFLFTGVAPFITFWKIYFHHISPNLTIFFGIEIPQIAINANKALLISLTNFFGLFSGLYLVSCFERRSVLALISFFLFFLSVNLMILTNSFYVFGASILVAVISFYGLFSGIFEQVEKRNFLLQLFTVISLILISISGIVLQSGSSVYASVAAGSVSQIFIFLLFLGFIILFNVFPVLSWVSNGISNERSILLVLYQVIFLSAGIYVFYTLSQLVVDKQFSNMFAILGMLTYFSASFLATGQISMSKVLGYLTSAQFGLIVAMIGLSRFLGLDAFYIIITIFLTHFIAKSGILFISNSFQQDDISKWSAIRKNPVILFLFGIFIFALAGMPPFPSFYVRWNFVQHLVEFKMYDWLICFAVAFLFESYYLFRWLSNISKKEKTTEYFNVSGFEYITGILSFVLLMFVSAFTLFYSDVARDFQFNLLMIVFLVYLLSFIPPAAQLIMSISFVTFPFLMKYQSDILSPQSIVLGVLAILTILTNFISYKRHRYQTSLYSIVILIFYSTFAIITSELLSSVFIWSLLLISGLYLYLVNKEKVKENALFFLLILTIAVAIAWVGIISGNPLLQQPKLDAFVWDGLPVLSKSLLIIGGIITVISGGILFVLGIRKKTSGHVIAYYSFRNVLAESIDRLLATRFIMVLISLLVVGVLFAFLWNLYS